MTKHIRFKIKGIIIVQTSLDSNLRRIENLKIKKEEMKANYFGEKGKTLAIQRESYLISS